MWDFRSRYRRWRASQNPVEAHHWRDALETSRYAQRLSHNDQATLRDLATQFLSAKTFGGAHNISVTISMRTRIALHACLPVLRLGLDYYRNWRGVIVYPGDFRVRRTVQDEAGVVHEGMEDLCGESLSQGPMVLSWDAMLLETQAPDLDLVIHECAHKLDVLNGDADGFPPLPKEMLASTWTREWKSAFDDFCRHVDAGRETRIDPYAATDPAEFFAVLSETFFTTPRWIRDDYPAIYSQLAVFYRQDTAAFLIET